MPRLVIVSNRTADPRKSAAGGLAVAVGEALQQTGGLWFGWSGKIVDSHNDPAGDPPATLQQAGKVTLAGIDLSQADHDSHYLGYSNGVLWPVFHDRLDLARFDAGLLQDFYAGYSRVNQLFARQLKPLLREDDIVWVHDYHLIPLAAELRALGCRQPMGFFLHIPLPSQVTLASIPQHDALMRALFDYDLIGLQSNQDLRHFEHYVCHEARGERLANEAEVSSNGNVGRSFRYRAWGKTVRCGAFPIGIDVDAFAAQAESREARDMYTLMKREYAARRLVLGIDRLDYSKGLAHRVRAFRELLANHPEQRRSATLIQIATPTRDSVDAYAKIRRELETLCGAINGDFGELDWIPVRYIHRLVSRRRLPGLCRAAAVGLVTPLRDGMNLVAKEYIAAQDPADPGVLVLSRFAGAAEQLKEALIVNPHDIHGTAEALHRALSMPVEERRVRHQKLLARLRQQDVHWWRRSFLDALAASAGERESV